MRATSGSVHSWELVTAVDGPGTRLTVFLAGCPLQCLYCHNPDTMQMRRGTDVTADEILARVARYRTVFAATGGGLTISGGEPLMQPAFVARLLRGAKAMGVHTTVDTSGFLGSQCTDAMLADIDLVLLDIKSGLPDTYRRVTGRALQPTLDFGRRLRESGTAHVGAVRPRPRADGRARERRGGRGARRGARERRRARRGAAVPPDGARQVGRAGDAVRAGGHRSPRPRSSSSACARRSGTGDCSVY